MKKYIIVAGVNGAGKTTLYDAEQIRKSDYRINADEILEEAGGDWRNASDVMNAGKTAVERLRKYLEDGVSLIQETTLCGHSVLNNIAKAKDHGYLIEMHYIGLSSAELAKEKNLWYTTDD